MKETGALFLSKSREYLNSYFESLEQALESSSDESVWWRPNESSNSIGNLLLHLTGSTRFWIAHVVAGIPSARVRQAEFDAQGGAPLEELLDGLRDVVKQADEVIAELTAEQLLESREHDGKTTAVLEAIYHAVEHFSMHTGQVLQIVKSRSQAASEVDPFLA